MIGKVVYYLLNNASAVTDIVGTKIYPEIAPENTTAPVVVYNVVNIVPDYSRSGHVVDQSDIDVLIFSKDYTDSITLLEACRTALEEKSGTFNGVQIRKAEVTGINAGFDQDADVFYWRMSLQFENL